MWSHDEGKSWSLPYFNPDLPDPIVQGSMILGSRTPARLGVGQPLFFTHPQSAVDRANNSLLMSTDGGARWTNLLQVHHGCSEYSGVVQFSDGKVGSGFDDGGLFGEGYKPPACKPRTNNES